MKRKGDAGGETIRETSLVSPATPREVAYYVHGKPEEMEFTLKRVTIDHENLNFIGLLSEVILADMEADITCISTFCASDKLEAPNKRTE
ncbi:hypothetical protein YC2023_113043 [Brassica napus]